MARCPGCSYPLPDDRERVGARCPNCRDPLYEPVRFGRPVRVGESPCEVHPTNEAIGPCQRCGRQLCEICRCLWQRQLICAVCAEKALAAGEGPIEPGREQADQAGRGLLFAGLAWLLGAAGVGLAVVGSNTTGPLALLLVFATFALLAAAGAAAVCALGQATAVVLAGGKHTRRALLGLVLAGVYLAVLVGLLSLRAWYA